MNILILKAEIKDIKEIQKLNRQLFEYENKWMGIWNLDWSEGKDGKEYFTSRINSENGIVLIAKDKSSDKIVGYIASEKKPVFTWRVDNPLAEIENMYVEEKYRREGVGGMLFEEFIRCAKERGVKKIYVEAVFENLIGRNFYKKYGFKEKLIRFEKNIFEEQ